MGQDSAGGNGELSRRTLLSGRDPRAMGALREQAPGGSRGTRA